MQGRVDNTICRRVCGHLEDTIERGGGGEVWRDIDLDEPRVEPLVEHHLPRPNRPLNRSTPRGPHPNHVLKSTNFTRTHSCISQVQINEHHVDTVCESFVNKRRGSWEARSGGEDRKRSENMGKEERGGRWRGDGRKKRRRRLRGLNQAGAHIEAKDLEASVPSAEARVVLGADVGLSRNQPAHTWGGGAPSDASQSTVDTSTPIAVHPGTYTLGCAETNLSTCTFAYVRGIRTQVY